MHANSSNTPDSDKGAEKKQTDHQLTTTELCFLVLLSLFSQQLIDCGNDGEIEDLSPALLA